MSTSSLKCRILFDPVEVAETEVEDWEESGIVVIV